MLSFVELQRVVAVLAPQIEGHRLQDIGQPDALRVVLSTWGPAERREDRGRHLLLCCEPDNARLSVLARPPKALPRPPAFTQYLRAHVAGSRIRGLRIEGGDRLVALDLETREGPARLLLSLFGRRSNAYLLDGGERVVAALRPLEETRPELASGEPWRPPASGPPRRGEDRFADAPDAELFEAIEAHYSRNESEGEHERLRRSIDGALRKEERRVERKLEKLRTELDAARAATGLERHGELLKSALVKVERGASEVVVRDWETGEDVRIELDPRRSPAENLEQLFKRYRKAVRSLTRGGAQEAAVQSARDEIAALRAEFEAAADDLDALTALAGKDPLRKTLARQAASPARAASAPKRAEVTLGKRSVPRRLVPRRYATADGLEVWVGRSDEANDFLTVRLARGKDLFFHLNGAPGSHVILRTEGRPDPPSEAILDACELAVHFSKAKKAGRADVHIVPIKNVRKPKGAKPGLVTVHGGRTLHLRRSESRLARILSARIEDPI